MLAPAELRYVRWDRGESQRECVCLALLAEHASGVARGPYAGKHTMAARWSSRSGSRGSHWQCAPHVGSDVLPRGSAAPDLDVPLEHIAGRLAGVFDANALVDAVGLSAEERKRMRAYRPLWAAFWLAMLLPGNGGFRRDPPGTTEAQSRHLSALLA